MTDLCCIIRSWPKGRFRKLIYKGSDDNLDNNLIERMQRLVSLLRRNSLFFGSHKGGETAAMYLSLVVSCRLNGIYSLLIKPL